VLKESENDKWARKAGFLNQEKMGKWLKVMDIILTKVSVYFIFI
jgi:hypothetical protein